MMASAVADMPTLLGHRRSSFATPTPASIVSAGAEIHMKRSEKTGRAKESAAVERIGNSSQTATNFMGQVEE